MNNTHSTIDQKSFIIDETKLKKAPKLFREDCKIKWTMDVEDVYNHIRGLDPYPSAWSEFKNKDNQIFPFKLFKPEKISGKHSVVPGVVSTDGKTFLYIAVNGGFISITDLLPAGKKRMSCKDFLRGFSIDETWTCT
jgi:methionyl-tRNA formyltransferase